MDSPGIRGWDGVGSCCLWQCGSGTGFMRLRSVKTIIMEGLGLLYVF